MAGGGAERQLTYLSSELVRTGWDVHVAVIQDGPNVARLDATGATVHRIRAGGNHDPLILARLIRTVRAVRPDVIQCWLLQMEVIGGLAAILTGTPWVFSERSAAEAYPPGAKTWLRVQVGRRANAIVSNSAIGDLYWRTRAGSHVKRFVIPNGLPLEEIAATLQRPTQNLVCLESTHGALRRAIVGGEERRDDRSRAPPGCPGKACARDRVRRRPLSRAHLWLDRGTAAG